MSETLFDRAISNFSAAQVNFGHRSDDEFFLNLTGYLLQQSVELALKHVLETWGIKYPRTHNIDELLSLVPSKLRLDTDSLLMMSGTITNWESKTRYIKNYFLEEKQLRIGFSVIGKFLHEVKSLDGSEQNSSGSVRKLNLGP